MALPETQHRTAGNIRKLRVVSAIANPQALQLHFTQLTVVQF
jgi:hypothetical protein